MEINRGVLDRRNYDGVSGVKLCRRRSLSLEATEVGHVNMAKWAPLTTWGEPARQSAGCQAPGK